MGTVERSLLARDILKTSQTDYNLIKDIDTIRKIGQEEGAESSYQSKTGNLEQQVKTKAGHKRDLQDPQKKGKHRQLIRG